ncbi:uncharacterized protein METZ01_LOCUS332442, partial [marine metagenome]
MSIKKTDLEYIASLSKLQFEGQELKNYTRQISDILEMIQQLQKVDTKKIKPMAHPMNMNQRIREDLVTEVNKRDEYQKNAVDS